MVIIFKKDILSNEKRIKLLITWTDNVQFPGYTSHKCEFHAVLYSYSYSYSYSIPLSIKVIFVKYISHWKNALELFDPSTKSGKFAEAVQVKCKFMQRHIASSDQSKYFLPHLLKYKLCIFHPELYYSTFDSKSLAVLSGKFANCSQRRTAFVIGLE